MIGCNDGFCTAWLTWIWWRWLLFKPNLTTLHHHFDLKLVNVFSSDFPNMGFNHFFHLQKNATKFPSWKSVVQSPLIHWMPSNAMETAKELTAVLTRGVTGLQSQSLDLPEFDDQSTFAATKIPRKQKKETVFQIRCFTKIWLNWNTKLNKGVFFPEGMINHAQNPRNHRPLADALTSLKCPGRFVCLYYY